MDLGTQFFTAAKAQHESGAKWSLIVLTVLLYFHLAIAGPFAQQTADKAAINQELTQNRAVEALLDPIMKSASVFVATVDAQVTAASSGLRDDLVAHFRLLEDKISWLATLEPEEAEGEAGAELFSSEMDSGFQPQQQQQPPQPSGELGTMLEPMPPPLRRLISEQARNPDQNSGFAQEMERYIEAFVITPAFARANELWASNHLRLISGEAMRLSSAIDAVAKEAGTPGDQVKQLGTAVAALRDEAQRLSFAPPANADWWRSVAGKETSIRSMVDAMRRGAGKLGQEQGLLQAAKNKASEAVAANQARAKDVDDRLAELERQARELQAQLGEIGEPLKVISVRLSVLAPLLPLVIALAIAALSLWRAEALRRMRFAASQAANEAGGGALLPWLREAAGGSAHLLAARQVAVGAVAIVWVLAAWQAVRALPAPHLSGLETVSIALAVVLIARAYHWHQSRRALALAGQK